jgi:hypothetical protein
MTDDERLTEPPSSSVLIGVPFRSLSVVADDLLVQRTGLQRRKRRCSLLLDGPTPSYWALGCRGLVREHLVPRVQGAGLSRRAPTCAGCADGHRSSSKT